jgi:carboxyl-terminal processing protease
MITLKSLKIFYFLIVISIVKLNAQESSVCEKSLMIVKTAEKYHYNPRKIDDDFSNIVFTNFLETIDPTGFFFTKEEYNLLENFKSKIDDEILSNSCTFLDKTTEIYLKNLDRIKLFIEKINNTEINLSEKDSLFIDLNNRFVNSIEFENKWKKIIKQEILQTYFSNYDTLEKPISSNKSILLKIKNELLQRELCRLTTKKNNTINEEQFVGNSFLKSVSFAFDPHTEYFTNDDKNSFNQMLSKNALSFGIQFFRNRNDEIEVYKINFGSPAWKSKQIDEGDIIYKIEVLGKKQNSLNCLSYSEAVKYIYSANNYELKFFIKKKNNKQIEVVLKNEFIDIGGNKIESYILENDSIKLGYIYFSSFYSQSDVPRNKAIGCSYDISKEILNLKSQKIDGLIIDLRNNGGGSMFEATQLAGNFIKSGPIGIIETKNSGSSCLNDVNYGTIYDDKLIVLINHISASASEYFTSAMQDYNRAIIVGTNSFGKATTQDVIPIEAFEYDFNSKYKTPEAYIKLTQGIIFRVTGKSNQKNGLIPDIYMPEFLDSITVNESKFISAIENKSTNKQIFYNPLNEINFEYLKQKSKERIDTNSIFKNVIKSSSLIKKSQNRFTVPLNIDDFRTFNKKLKAEYELYNKYERPNNFCVFDANNDSLDLNKFFREKVQTDIYIGETFNIFYDFINPKK